ncbi:disease resistance protein-like [Dorcoceras hygrometricum]|uniref:Disease resistance protein-like n=1 Tax=Dorcoceras hygrometricum TaxID=472368 RepID=A0A2Z7A500_9LAMI|nr:disease resistance protein-like [Dorcoceras hygrometricum]
MSLLADAVDAHRRTPLWPSWQGNSVPDNLMCFLVQGSEGIWKSVVDRIRRTIGDSTVEVLLLRKPDSWSRHEVDKGFQGYSAGRGRESAGDVPRGFQGYSAGRGRESAGDVPRG